MDLLFARFRVIYVLPKKHRDVQKQNNEKGAMNHVEV